MDVKIIVQAIITGAVVTVVGGLFLWALKKIIESLEKTMDRHTKLIEKLFEEVTSIGKKYAELYGEHKRNHESK